MIQRFIILGVMFLGLRLEASSQTIQQSWEIYGEASTTGTFSLLGETGSGFRVGTTWKPISRFGLVADFESQPKYTAKDVSFTSLMAGVRVYSDEHYRLSGFLQALAGSYRANAPVINPETNAWHARLCAGAGADIRITKYLSLRPVEFDLTFLDRLLAARASTGMVVHFGR